MALSLSAANLLLNALESFDDFQRAIRSLITILLALLLVSFAIRSCFAEFVLPILGESADALIQITL